MNQSICIVEDDAAIGRLLKFNFENEGFAVDWFQDGAEGLEAINEKNYTLYVLDIMLPKVDGLTVLKNLREKNKNVPVIILSAKGTAQDRIEGLELDADDYLAKPFHFKELLLRSRNLIKKEKTSVKPINNIQLNSWSVSLSDGRSQNLKTMEEFFLTEKELGLLNYFYQQKNSYVSRSSILSNVWGMNPETKTRTVDIFISRLRKYFELDPGKPQVFLSKRIKGYMLKI